MTLSTDLMRRLTTALSNQGAANELQVLLNEIGSPTTPTTTDSITAHSGGGQSSAVALTSTVNRVTTVANPADSVALPTSAAGLIVFVINAGANSLQVFGTGADTINGKTATTGVSQMPGAVSTFYCVTAGSWTADMLGKSVDNDGNSGSGTVTLDMSVSDFHLLTLTGNPTLAVSNVGNIRLFSLILAQDATGSRTVTWFSGISWAGGSPPTLTATASKRDVFNFVNLGGGAYLGSVAGQNY